MQKQPLLVAVCLCFAAAICGCKTIMPIQNVTGAGVSPQGTAFFIEVRNNGASEYLLICKEIASGEGDCRRTEIAQPQSRGLGL